MTGQGGLPPGGEWVLVDLDFGADEGAWSGDPLDLLEAAADVRALITQARPAWHADAACRGQGAATWFPGRGDSLEPARAVCGSCPVAVECISAGIDEEYGVWAGTSSVQRRNVRKEAPKEPLTARACEWCGIEFTPAARTSRHCGRKCSHAASRRTAA